MSAELSRYRDGIRCKWDDRHEDENLMYLSTKNMKETRIERNNPHYQNRPDYKLREKCPSDKSEIDTLPSSADESHTDDHHTEYRIRSLELNYRIRKYFREFYSRKITYDTEEECVYRRKLDNLHEALSS